MVLLHWEDLSYVLIFCFISSDKGVISVDISNQDTNLQNYSGSPLSQIQYLMLLSYHISGNLGCFKAFTTR